MAGKMFTWQEGQLRTNVIKLPALVTKLIIATTEYHATLGEAYMRKNAKWKDRTTNARNSLHTATLHENTGTGSRHTITFAHGMPYGIWLEIRFADRFAIIMPSVLRQGPMVMNALDRGMARIK